VVRGGAAADEPVGALGAEPGHVLVERAPGHTVLAAEPRDVDLLAMRHPRDRGHELRIHRKPCSGHPRMIITTTPMIT
jgi:hypothetical protein